MSMCCSVAVYTECSMMEGCETLYLRRTQIKNVFFK